MNDDLDFYDLLDVDEDASQEAIRKGFREQVREYHPDLNDDPRAPAQFTALKKAYDTLGDPKEREAYDRLGHEEYVSNRISGLPSPEDWMVPGRREGEDGQSAGDTTTDADDGRSTGTTNASRTSDRSSGAGSRTTGASKGRDRTSEASGSTEAGGSTRDRGGPTGATGSSGRTGSSGSTPRAGSSNGTPTESAARNAGTTGRGTNGATAEESTSNGEAGSTGSSLWVRIEGAMASLVGWPLIVAADVLFLTSLGLYAAAVSGGIERLIDALGAAGADPDAIGTVLSGRPAGFESVSSFVGSELSASPARGFVVLVGLAFLPSVYFFMVRWTRNNRAPWQPSYLYVLGAATPLAALLASMLLDSPGVFVEVFGVFVVPVTTIVAMLFFAQVKPRVARVYRRWRYRQGS